MSKAWCCCEEELGVVEVVFADTRGKAKSYFKNLETFDDYRFCELRPHRLKKLDYLNHPDGYVMDFCKDEDMIPMVKEFNMHCSEITEECKECCVYEWCNKFEEW